MDFEFKILDESYVDKIMELQEMTFKWIEDKSILRKNSRENFLRCLKLPNYTLGAFFGESLAGIAILEFPDRAEDLSLLSSLDIKDKKCANYKLVIVNKNFLGHGLQLQFATHIFKKAEEEGIDILFCTISPENPHSLNNALKAGFVIDRELEKYGSRRYLLYKNI